MVCTLDSAGITNALAVLYTNLANALPNVGGQTATNIAAKIIGTQVDPT